jgi:hypothetical protein
MRKNPLHTKGCRCLFDEQIFQALFPWAISRRRTAIESGRDERVAKRIGAVGLARISCRKSLCQIFIEPFFPAIDLFTGGSTCPCSAAPIFGGP